MTTPQEQPDGHTKGPWGWFGNESGIYLATPDRGRTYVMGFRRHGLQGAQPTFREGGIMRPAAELVRFAVGEGEAKGFAAGRTDRSVYRYDISDVDHPDARLIAAAPDMLEALRYAENTIVAMRPTFSQVKDDGHAYHDQVLDTVRAAIAKALGQ